MKVKKHYRKIKGQKKPIKSYYKKKPVKQDIGAINWFDIYRYNDAKKFTKKWRKKGFRVFLVGVDGSDTYDLVASKRKPTIKQISNKGYNFSGKIEEMKESDW